MVQFTDLPFAAILVGALLFLGLGALWYGPLFGERWLRALGKRREDLGAPGPAYALAAVASLVASFVLALLTAAARPEGYLGTEVGFMAGVGFVATAFLLGHAFAGRSWRSWAIDSGYPLLALMAVGTLYDFWPW